jgi:GNAT superfamily N-acetyltransferase
VPRDPDLDVVLVRRITQAWARDAAVFVETLLDVDASWGSETFELAGGWVVLSGMGLYVNRAIACGQAAPLTSADWETLEARSAARGVAAAIEVTPASDPSVRETARERGYARERVLSALVRTTDVGGVPPPASGFDVVPANRELLRLWQETAASGWGHTDPAARRASDVFAEVAAIVDGEGFVLLREAGSGLPLGCASLTTRDGVATLGGMSTRPDARGRGVQTALIRHRLRVAAAAGCDVASSIAVPDGPSERNLVRHGLARTITIEHWVRPLDPNTAPAERPST